MQQAACSDLPFIVRASQLLLPTGRSLFGLATSSMRHYMSRKRIMSSCRGTWAIEECEMPLHLEVLGFLDMQV